MGLAGMALALAGCDVMLTDVAEVLPLLRRNVAQVRPEALKAAAHDGARVRHDAAGRAEVRELDWAAEGHAVAAMAEAAGWGAGAAAAAAAAKGARGRRRSSSSNGGGGVSGGGGGGGNVDAERKSGGGGDGGGGNGTAGDARARAAAPPPPPPRPFDVILAADCVYSEAAIPVFLAVCLAVSGRRTSILVANETRSLTTAAEWQRVFSEHFLLKRIPHAKMHPEYRHPLIALWQLRRRRAPGEGIGGEGEEEGEEEEEGPEAAGDEGTGEAAEALAGEATATAAAAALGALALVEEEGNGCCDDQGDEDAKAAG